MNIPTEPFDAFAESSKAFAELIMGNDQTDLFHEELLSHSQLIDENEKLRTEVASLKESLPFKDKYSNLQKEFRKVAAERDSLSAQALKFTSTQAEYQRLKDAYQKTKGQLATLEEEVKNRKTLASEYSALETLYQGFKIHTNRSGIDIRRIPTDIQLQFKLQDGTNRTLSYMFRRTSHSDWKRI